MLRFTPIIAFSALACEPTIAAGGERCFANWSEAAPIVQREALVAVEDVSSRARASLGNAEVVRTMLCESDGHFVYRLLVRTTQGHLRFVNVDARKPFEN